MDCQNGVYSIGTEEGVIKNWLPRSEFQLSAATFLKTVPADKEISLREAAARQSPFGGQGFQKCQYRPSKNMCGTRRCAC